MELVAHGIANIVAPTSREAGAECREGMHLHDYNTER